MIRYLPVVIKPLGGRPPNSRRKRTRLHMKPGYETHLEKRIEELKAQTRRFKDELRAVKSELEACRLDLKRREKIYQAVPSAVVLVIEGLIEDVNGTVAEQLAYSPEELLGRDFMSIVAPESKALVREVHAGRVARKAVPEQYEAVFMTRDGRPFPFEVRVRKILVGRKSAFVLSLTPMEKRREREENRLRAKKTEAVLTMASALSGAFGSYCSELQGGVERLVRAASGRQGDFAQEIQGLESVVAEVIETGSLLNTLARDRMNPSEARPFYFRDVVREAVSLGRAAIAADAREPPLHQVKTYLRSGSRILGNPEELRDVIAHLVKNSLEAMPDGGQLYVTSEEIGGVAQLTIMDNGTGVPEQIMDRIFDPFFTTRGERSSGIGLSVAYAVIQRHGGGIEVTSEKGLGTEIRVSLPVAPPDPASTERPPDRPRRPEKVLVIAAGRVLRDVLDRLITARGWQVVTASGRSEGLARFRREKFGGVIVEQGRLGVEKAVSLCRRLKAGNESLPVVLIVDDGVIQDTELINGNAAPFDLVISKPLFMEKFQAGVLRLFRGL